MSHTLQDRLAQLRRRLRQLLLLNGLSWLATIVVGALLIAGIVDWMVHLDDTGVRLMLGLGILATEFLWARRILDMMTKRLVAGQEMLPDSPLVRRLRRWLPNGTDGR